jgi:hypothetical protein
VIAGRTAFSSGQRGIGGANGRGPQSGHEDVLAECDSRLDRARRSGGDPRRSLPSADRSLAERDAAIVSKTPGTTRDIVEENILIEGAPLNILDTAGIRESKDDIEEEDHPQQNCQ